MRGLKFKLVSLCVGMVLLFAVATSLLFYAGQRKQRESMTKNLQTFAINLDYALAAQFFERYGDVQAFGMNHVFSTKDTAAMQAVLNSYVKSYGIYDLILFVDTKGNIIASNTASPKGKTLNLSSIQSLHLDQEPWFTNALSGRTTDDPARGFAGTYFEDLHVNSIVKNAVGTDGYVTIFSSIVKDAKGNTIGVLANFANSIWIEQEFVKSFDTALEAGIPSPDFIMVNKKGYSIVSYEPSSFKGDRAIRHDFDKVLLKKNLAEMGDEAMKHAITGKVGSGEFIQFETGVLEAAGWSPVESEKFITSIGWNVLAQLDSSDYFAELDAATRLFFSIGSGILILCIGAGFWYASSLARLLQRLSDGISTAGETVGAASSELAAASQQVSSGTIQAASSLEETVASLEELTGMVRLNSDNASQAASLAQSSSKTAETGETEVRALIVSITELAQSSRKIEAIINVIDDIAFQTNLLALNAAVEAARAGEQGKGFAVVAEAVRTLAQRSATAAKEISGLIRDNVAKIDNGTQQADRSGLVLKEILVSVRKVADISNEIAAASQEQTTGLSQISKAMNELDQATQRNAATSEEVAASSDSMMAQAVDLQNLVQELNQLIHGGDASVASNQAVAKQSPRVSQPIAKTRANGIKLLKNKNASVVPRPNSSARLSQLSSTTPRSKRNAEEVIPFGDDQDGDGKIGNISGF